MPALELSFPNGATARELKRAVDMIAEEDLDKAVAVMVRPFGSDDEDPYIMVGFRAFPARIEDPQPPVVIWIVDATEGDLVAVEVETLRMFEKFRQERGDDSGRGA